MICTDENNPVVFSLSPGDAGDAPYGRELIKKLEKQNTNEFQENEHDRKFFIEIEGLLFNNEYVKHVFKLK